MKRKLYSSLWILFFLVNSLVYAEEKYFYLKGESDGIQIKIKMLSKYTLDYEKFKSYNELWTFLADDSNFFMGKGLEICLNDFPVEIINRSGKSIKFSRTSDSLTFILDGKVQIPYYIYIDEEKGCYPDILEPNENCSFIMEPLLLKTDFSYELYYHIYNIHKFLVLADYQIKQKIKTEDTIIESIKILSAVFRTGIGMKTINLYPVYE